MIDRARRQVPLEQGLTVGDDAVMGVRITNVDAEQHGGSPEMQKGRAKMEKGESKANWRISKEPGRRTRPPEEN
jgi:hypothetical protein